MARKDPEMRREYMRSYYTLNRLKLRAEQKAWRNSDAGKAHRFGRLLKRVGITADDWHRAWLEQDGKCAGCLSVLDGGQNTHIDHCHQTGRFRGLLCAQCNLALGKVFDSRSTLLRLADYLKRGEQ